MNEALEEVFRRNKRVAIVGGPRSGKTTLAEVIKTSSKGLCVIHGDDYKDLEWSYQSEYLIDLTYGMTEFIVEGVQVARALRKGMIVDAIIYLTDPIDELTEGQTRMDKGVKTIIEGWRTSTDIPIYEFTTDDFHRPQPL